MEKVVHFDQKTIVLIVIVYFPFIMKSSISFSQGGLRSINGTIVPLPLGVNRVEPSTDKNRQRSYHMLQQERTTHQQEPSEIERWPSLPAAS